MTARRKCKKSRKANARADKRAKKANLYGVIHICITKVLAKANAITHDGKFHVDEILATIIISIARGITTILCRTSNLPKDLADDVVVYDIGGGRLDHHQKGGNGVRPNGVPYASAGLAWKEYGMQIVANTPNPELVWKIVDRDLIQGVDASDNGACPKSNYPARAMSLSRIVSDFNPKWDSEEDEDEAFMKALAYVKTVFDNVLADAISKAKAEPIIEEAIDKSEGDIMVLEKYAPWQEFIFTSENEKAARILYIVYPSKRGGWCCQAVPASQGNFEQRKSLPGEWRGLRERELQMVTGIKTAKFCHKAGFIAGAETFEDTFAMAKLAVEAKKIS